MTQIELASGVLADFDRIIEHLESHGSSLASEHISQINQAIQILTHSPLIGRKVKDGKRELVIGKGSRGYVALYRFIPQIDTVAVLALRSQRELGFADGN